MPEVLVLSSSKPLCDSLTLYFNFVYGCNPKIIPFNKITNDNILTNFKRITGEIESVQEKSLFNTIAFVDFFDEEWSHVELDKLDAMNKNGSKSALVAMLQLCFPEIYWVFFTPYSFCKKSNENNWTKFLTNYHTLDHLSNIVKFVWEYGYVPLFDFAGIRNLIKKNMGGKKEKYQIRDERNASIDEEEEYSFFLSYIAYRLGYLSVPVFTNNLMTKFFGDSVEEVPEFSFTFQDIYLNMADYYGAESQSDLHKRFTNGSYKRFNDIKKHIFLTVGHKHSQTYNTNQQFLRERKFRKIYKPSGGFYNILSDAKLDKEYFKRIDNWIKDTKPVDTEENRGGHSAPGRLQLISEFLIKRAEKILNSAKTVEECVAGAIMASDAVELLNFKTPTTVLEAIALKHQLEVKAECLFYGVSYNINVTDRIKDLENEINAVSRWFNSSLKEKSSLNAMINILTEITRIFREYGQFDEDQKCLMQIRDYHRKWYYKNAPLLNRLGKPFRWYVHLLLRSFRNFVFALFFWPIFMSIIGYLMGVNLFTTSQLADGKIGILKLESIWDYISYTFITFFGIQPLDFPTNFDGKIYIGLLMLLGFVHLGIFVAHLYTLVSRRW